MYSIIVYKIEFRNLELRQNRQAVSNEISGENKVSRTGALESRGYNLIVHKNLCAQNRCLWNGGMRKLKIFKSFDTLLHFSHQYIKSQKYKFKQSRIFTRK